MKIAVIGSINIDFTVTADRIPSKGETVPGKGTEIFFGGKGANQAVAMALLGADVEMYGAVGRDENGVKAMENLKSFGVDTSFIKRSEKETGLAVITLGEKDNTIVVIKGAGGDVDISYAESISKRLKDCQMAVLQHEIPMETVEYIVNFCEKAGIPTLLNPAPAMPLPMSVIEKVTYLTPNEHELGIIFPNMTMEETLKKYPRKVIVTLGAKGAAYCDGEKIVSVPSRKASVTDTTGAGDTFCGAFAVKRAEGQDIYSCVSFANLCASLSTEKKGAQKGMPTLAQAEAAK